MTTAARKGISSALLAALLFGLSAPFAKLLLGATRPQLLAGLLYLGSGTGLLVLWLLRRRGGARANALTRRDLPWLAGTVVCGGTLAPLLLMFGLTRTPASAASLLLNLEGVFTALLAGLVFGERFDGRVALGMATIVAGGAVLSWEGRLAGGGLVGPLAVAAAALAWATDNNLTQKISAGDPVQIATIKGLVAGSTNLAIALALGAAWPAPATIGAAMTLGFACYGVSLTLFVLALRDLGAARTSALFSVAPFVGAVASLIVFRERPGMLLVVGAALMAVGAALIVGDRRESAP